MCSENERRSYGFGTTWRWVINNRIFIFEWTNPLRYPKITHSPRNEEFHISLFSHGLTSSATDWSFGPHSSQRSVLQKLFQCTSYLCQHLFKTLLLSTFQRSSFKTLQRHLSPAVLYFLSLFLWLCPSLFSHTLLMDLWLTPPVLAAIDLLLSLASYDKTIACLPLSLSLSLSERNNLLHEGSVGSQWTLNSVWMLWTRN